MKLRVRINRQTSLVELQGEEPSVTELLDHIRHTVLPSHGLRSDAEFILSLNGSTPLSDSGQTLLSCGIVLGDLICVMLPGSPSAIASAQQGASCSAVQRDQNRTRPAASMTSNQDDDEQPSVSVQAAGSGEEEAHGLGVCSWEPMLCSEAESGQAPLSLELLYHQSRSPSDALMLAAHVLMLETGFVPQGCELMPGEMPSGWRAAGGLYRLQYTHPLCENSLAMVLAVPMGPLVVINATLKVNQTVDTVRKLCVNPCSYVTDDWPGESAAAALKDLSRLSRVFKDQLVYPLISAARDAMCLPVAFGLAALPPELLLRVMRLLDIPSLLKLSGVSKHFHSATADYTLWRHLYRRDFRDPNPIISRETDWKQLYKIKFKSRTQSRRFSSQCPYRHIIPVASRPFNSEPNPLLPPGIIGGEFDQRPNIPLGLLPRPRFDPMGPLPDHGPGRRLAGLRGVGPAGCNRPTNVRRGFI
ncbi:F-box only protein 7 [Genypterus blacodes]|uniref:F-box only protein 7 n=1 Tax=Genypterus blacodes TaxID=154954 RepID=UPI003F763E2C